MCTATTPTAPANSRTGWSGPGSSPSARPSRPSPRAGVRQGPLRHRSGRRHGPLPGREHHADRPRPATAPAPPRSARYARGVRCVSSAPTAQAGRTISVGVHEGALAAARARQRHPDWVADYRATRPKVERKFGHLMRRKHGGRRARVRGTDQDRRRLRPAGRRGQPRTAGRARRGFHARPRVGHSGRVDQRGAGIPYPAAETPTRTPQSPASTQNRSRHSDASRSPSATPSAHRRSSTSDRHRQPFDTSHLGRWTIWDFGPLSAAVAFRVWISGLETEPEATRRIGVQLERARHLHSPRCST